MKEAQRLATAFYDLVSQRKAGDLGAWMKEVTNSDLSEIKSFVQGVKLDERQSARHWNRSGATDKRKDKSTA